MVWKAKQYMQHSMAQHSTCLRLLRATSAWITTSFMHDSPIRTTMYVLQS